MNDQRSPTTHDDAQSKRDKEDIDALIQGLTPVQIDVLAQKVYDLLLDELRLEAERYGQGSFQ
jgi:hypothetical protein